MRTTLLYTTAIAPGTADTAKLGIAAAPPPDESPVLPLVVVAAALVALMAEIRSRTRAPGARAMEVLPPGTGGMLILAALVLLAGFAAVLAGAGRSRPPVNRTSWLPPASPPAPGFVTAPEHDHDHDSVTASGGLVAPTLSLHPSEVAPGGMVAVAIEGAGIDFVERAPYAFLERCTSEHSCDVVALLFAEGFPGFTAGGEHGVPAIEVAAPTLHFRIPPDVSLGCYQLRHRISGPAGVVDDPLALCVQEP